MWIEQNYSEAFAKKQIVPADCILDYLNPDQPDVVGSSETNCNWVKNFCAAQKTKWFVEIDDEFLKEPRNYANLPEILKPISPSPLKDSDEKFGAFYDMAKYLIKTKDTETEDTDPVRESEIYSLNEDDEKILEDLSEALYGLLHARYIITTPGLIQMAQKFQRREFGTCLRIGCKSNPVLPIGLSDIPLRYPVKVFCPLCHDIYNLPDDFADVEKTDGAYFGRSFSSIFMLNFPQFCDESSFTFSNGPDIYKIKQQDKTGGPKKFYVKNDAETGKPNDLDTAYEKLAFFRRTVSLENPMLP